MDEGTGLDRCRELLEQVFDLLAGQEDHAESCRCSACEVVARIWSAIGAWAAQVPPLGPEDDDDDTEDKTGFSWPELPTCRRRQVLGIN